MRSWTVFLWGRLRRIVKRSPDSGETDSAGQLVIFEPSADGHRFFYVKLLLNQAYTNGKDAVLLTSLAARDSTEAHIQLGSREGSDKKLQIIPVCESPPYRFTPRYKALRRVAQYPLGESRLLIPDADGMLLALLLARRLSARSVHLLLMRPNGHAGHTMQYVFKVMVCNLLRMLKGYQISRLVVPLTSGNFKPPIGLSWTGEIEDPLPATVRMEMVTARLRLGIPLDRTACLLAGRIDQRKSVSEILHWLANTKIRPKPVLLLAGQIPSETRQLIESLLASKELDSKDIVLKSGYVEDAELSLLYSASDCVFLMYENRGSSGAFAHAMAHRRQVVAWGNPDVVNATKILSVGVVLEEREPAHIDAAIISLTRLEWPSRVDRMIDLRELGAHGLQQMVPIDHIKK